MENKIKFVNLDDLYTATGEIWTKAKEAFGSGGGSSVEVVLTTGTSTEAVMSLNAVTDALSNVATLDNTGKVPSSQLNSDVVEGYYRGGLFYTSLADDCIKIGSLYWMTKNIGADSVTGTGLYFQWGDTQGYTAAQCGSGSGQKYFDWADYKYSNNGSSTVMTKYNSTDGKTTLDLEDDAAYAALGGSWRMPTYNEYVALANAVNTAWTNDYQGSGVTGLVLTDKTDSSKVLFFPAVDYLFLGLVYSTVNDTVCALSSSIHPSKTTRNYALSAYPNRYDDIVGDFTHCCGLLVRAVSSTEPLPDNKYKMTPETEKVYIDVSTNKIYRWNGSEYILISPVYETEVDALTRHTRKTDFDLDVLKQAVADQNLEKYGLKVGDEKTINGHTYVIAGLNCMKGSNSYTATSNHVGLIVIPHTTLAWNASGTTYTGANNRGAGYLNSDLHYYLKNTVLPLAKTDLGVSNLIAHNKYLTSDVNTTGYDRYGSAGGCSSSATYSNEYISALSEMQVYGGTIWSSSGYDTGEADQQLEVFKHYKHTDIFGDGHVWLRDVTSTNNAAYVGSDGFANTRSAALAFYVAGLILFH